MVLDPAQFMENLLRYYYEKKLIQIIKKNDLVTAHTFALGGFKNENTDKKHKN